MRSNLLGNAKVGEVNKFQGQEAPIVLIPMVTSNVEDLSRNIKFLYSKKPPVCCCLPYTLDWLWWSSIPNCWKSHVHCGADEMGQQILLFECVCTSIGLAILLTLAKRCFNRHAVNNTLNHRILCGDLS